MTKTNGDNALIKYWQLIVVLSAGGVAWGTLSADVESLKKDSIRDEEKVATLMRQDAELKNKLTKLETNQEHIKEDLQEAKRLAEKNTEKLDRILEEIRKDDKTQ